MYPDYIAGLYQTLAFPYGYPPITMEMDFALLLAKILAYALAPPTRFKLRKCCKRSARRGFSSAFWSKFLAVPSLDISWR